MTVFFVGIRERISCDIFLFDVIKISKLIHEIDLRVEIISYDTIKLKIHVEGWHFEVFLLRNEHFRVLLKLWFGVINKLSINENLIFVNVFNLFLFVLLLCLDNIGSYFILSIRVDMRIEDNK